MRRVLVIATVIAVACAALYQSLAAQPVTANPPRGTIVAWWVKSGPLPAGWAICDGANGTPDLRGRFIRGASNIADNGKAGGSSGHSHSGTASSEITKEGWIPGRQFESEGDHTANHRHPVSTDAQSHLPPYTDIVYIMRVK